MATTAQKATAKAAVATPQEVEFKRPARIHEEGTVTSINSYVNPKDGLAKVKVTYKSRKGENKMVTFNKVFYDLKAPLSTKQLVLFSFEETIAGVTGFIDKKTGNPEFHKEGGLRVSDFTPVERAWDDASLITSGAANDTIAALLERQSRITGRITINAEDPVTEGEE
jgi:hypothetical protein